MKIIINADDFGISKNVNYAIYKAAKSGYITSSTILITGEMSEEAIKMIADIPEISFGIHLALTDNLNALSIKSTLNKHNWNYKGINIFKLPSIIKEFRLQIEKLQTAGVSISHIDTHHHIHRFPLVLIAVIFVAKKYKINKIRTQVLYINPKKINKIYRLIHSYILRFFNFTLVDFYTDFSTVSNNMEGDGTKNKTLEIMCHPGSLYNDEKYFNSEFYSNIKDKLINYELL